MNKNDMPILRPIPIDTKNKPLLLRIWTWITSIRKWEVADEWRHTLPDGTPVIVPKTFVFDGASIPKPLWVILSPTGLLLVPGLIHDFAYRYDYLWALDEQGNAYKYKENAGRRTWDKLFAEVGVQVNGLALIDYLARVALTLFGWWSWCKNRKRNAEEIVPDRPVVEQTAIPEVAAQEAEETPPVATA